MATTPLFWTARASRLAVMGMLVFALMIPSAANASSTSFQSTRLVSNTSSVAPRQVNVWPAVGPVSYSWNTASLFWFGQATSTGESSNDYADVRLAYDSQNLYVYATIVDYYLWYDPTGTSDPRTYDAFAVYLDTHGDRESSPQADDYFFVSGFRSYPAGNNPAWHVQGQGNGSGWNESWSPSPAWTDNPGGRWYNSGPNNNSDLDAGWTTTIAIPWATVGVGGPPASGSVWGIGATLYNRNDQPPAGAVTPENWPETFSDVNPSSWGSVVFNPPAYQPLAATNTQTITLRQGLNNEVVPDAYVGGGGSCNGGIYGGGDTPHPTDDLFVQDESDVSDFPCFSKSFLQFDLSQIPAGKVITSASLTIYEFGGSNPSAALPSYIQLFAISDAWSETTLTWNNEPLAAKNLTATWVNPLPTFPGWPGVPATWDATQLVAEAYAAAQPANLALYDADTAYNSGKYFTSSDAGDWDATGRPTLTVTFGDPTLGLSMTDLPTTANQTGVVTCTVVVSGRGQATQVAVAVPTQLTYVVGSATGGATFDSASGTIQWSGTPNVGTPTSLSFQLQVTSGSAAFTPLTATATDSGGASASAVANLLINPFTGTLPIQK